MPKKVFISGCFDMLHSGHVEFFQQAASYGDLYVALGSDSTVYSLKGRLPVNSEAERLFMAQSISCVKHAFVSSGSGMLDFEKELREIKPDIFVVNADGNIPEKEALCQKVGVEYVVLERQPHDDLPARSTTDLRKVDQMPYRIDLAGGWLDQPFVSKFYPGPVITISLEPTISFNERSGMATSTRNHAIDLWNLKLPPGDPEKLAKILFCYDNPPGTENISGSQDAIGIVFPGLAYAYYEGKYWPTRIEQHQNEATLQFIENALYLIPLSPRESDYNPLNERYINEPNAKALSDAAQHCWEAILRGNVADFGLAIRQSYEAQIAMFPQMVNSQVQEMVSRYQEAGALGWKLSGAGGGGYLILVSDKPIKNAVRIRIRRQLE